MEGYKMGNISYCAVDTFGYMKDHMDYNNVFKIENNIIFSIIMGYAESTLWRAIKELVKNEYISPLGNNEYKVYDKELNEVDTLAESTRKVYEYLVKHDRQELNLGEIARDVDMTSSMVAEKVLNLQTWGYITAKKKGYGKWLITIL